jgi:hypothetical protein
MLGQHCYRIAYSLNDTCGRGRRNGQRKLNDPLEIAQCFFRVDYPRQRFARGRLARLPCALAVT